MKEIDDGSHLVRLKDDEHGGRPRILKLKDWPTKKDFASVFPTLLHDLMNNIPFSKYKVQRRMDSCSQQEDISKSDVYL